MKEFFDEFEAKYPKDINFNYLTSLSPKDMKWEIWLKATEQQKQKYRDYQYLRAGIDLVLIEEVLPDVNNVIASFRETVPLYGIKDIYTTDYEALVKIKNILDSCQLYEMKYNYYPVYSPVQTPNIKVRNEYLFENGNDFLKEKIDKCNKEIEEYGKNRELRDEHKNKAVKIQEVLEEMETVLNNDIQYYYKAYELYRKYTNIIEDSDDIMNLLRKIHNYADDDLDTLQKIIKMPGDESYPD